jgi:hypothetical protein
MKGAIKMNKRSNQIKIVLDSTYFKDTTFKASQKYFILNRIKNNDKPPIRSNYRFKKPSASVFISF